MTVAGESAELILVAVYGTLKSGMQNCHLLDGARLLGTDRLKEIVLYDLGSYPAARLGASTGIEVEVYEIRPEMLQALDELEEYDPLAVTSSLYRRVRIQTAFGDSWIYLYNGSLAGRRPVRAGGWIPRNTR